MIDGLAVAHLLARRPRLTLVVATVVVSLPLLVVLADLRSSRWHPVLDLAWTELRVRDTFGRHTPLIGLPGRITQGPGQEQGSHPGPLSFYLLAPPYRLLGSTSWALQAANVVVHVAAIATSLWIGQRRAGWRGVVAVAALLAIVIRGYGQLLLTQPWNPYLPLLAWLVVLVASWAVLCGDTLMLMPLVVAGSLCAQTHIPYVLPAGGLTIAALAVVAWPRVRAVPGSRGVRAVPGRRGVRAVPGRRGVRAVLGRRGVRAVLGRRGSRLHAAIATGLGVALWIPPLIDQAVDDRGNITKLIDHFGDPPGPAIGFVDGARHALRHLDAWAGFAGFTGDLEGSGRFVSPAVAWRGAIVLAIWAASAVYAWRRASNPLRALHGVIAGALFLGFVSMARIFGLPWYYLTLWAWGTTSLLLGAIVWTVISWWRTAAPARSTDLAIPALSAAVVTVLTVSSSITFASAEVPEERLSDAVEALAGPTYDAVADGVGAASGPGVRYQVRWSDAADIGSPGYGLFLELERRGLDVAADEMFHVTVTDHRARPRGDEGAQIHVATGAYIDRWRDVPFAVEVATYEPRTADEIVRYRDIRDRVIARLLDEGLDDVVPMIDTNLFGASLQPQISAADLADITELLALGQPMSVFIVPAGLDAVL